MNRNDFNLDELEIIKRFFEKKLKDNEKRIERCCDELHNYKSNEFSDVIETLKFSNGGSIENTKFDLVRVVALFYDEHSAYENALEEVDRLIAIFNRKEK